MGLPLLHRMLLISGMVFTEDSVDYQKQVRHVFQERCFACHGALKQEGGLRVDTAALAIKGGDSGHAIVPSRPEESSLLQRISAADISVRMPPEGEALKPDEISAIRKWIEQGALAPADEKPESDPREHWAFKVPVRPEVPEVADAAWVLNPIDAFIAKTHQEKGLSAQPAADRRVWLRRVSLDLTGLPPTPEEQQLFLTDESPEAWSKVVDRLLASPQYGERWGRHWMDIWRYSDWWGLGAEVRNSQKHIWHWRDWIVESVNSDKAYDQMLREMLAADELYPNDMSTLRASGFLARQYFKFNRTSWLDETVEHTSKAMLGLTFNCAKCHDHKYDPVSQVEYYQMRAIFEPYQVRTDAVAGELDFEKNGIPRAFDCNLDATTYVHVRGDDRNPDKERVISPAVPAFLSNEAFHVQSVKLPPDAFQPGLRAHVIDTYLKDAETRIADTRTALEEAKNKLSAASAAYQASLKDKPAGDLQDQGNPEKNEPAEVLVSDDFRAERPEIWDQRSGVWRYENGKLIQSQVGANRASLRLKSVPPADFQATLQYRPTGGETWKSVGIRFDLADSDENESQVYLSSYAAGPKTQVSYRQNGSQAYPNEAAEARPVNLNEVHDLTIRVRGTLVNVVVDGKASVAYRLPFDRRPGMLELITFDASAEFHGFSLSELPASAGMTEAPGHSSDSPLTVAQASLAVKVAEKSLARALSEPASIQARAVAERASLERPDDPATAIAVAAAVRSEGLFKLAGAEEALAVAELGAAQATPEKKAAAESLLETSRANQETALKAIDQPGGSFTPLAGALKTLESNLETEDSRRKPFPKESTGRRTALARWITDPQNPLPARVAVNHVWARHFGKGLVPTVFDFGRKGTPPTHPELLDWLAVEFVEHGWSMKHLHRLIVLSGTYRMTSSSLNASENNLKMDEDNRFYWRRNPVRMESQIVRDSLLSIAGELDLTMGGPSIPVADDNSRRRSLYYVHSHNEHQKFLSIFDDANVLECYRRSESIVPQQALALENSPLARSMAERIAARIEARISEASDQAFVAEAFRTVLAVEATAEEMATCIEALSLFAAASAENAASKSRVNLIQALLNHNDFVTVR